MPNLIIKIHKSISIPNLPIKFQGNYSGVTILEAINKLLDNYKDIKELCIVNGSPKPGILFIAKGAELKSLGLLNNKLDEDLEIRIVPVLHGG